MIRKIILMLFCAGTVYAQPKLSVHLGGTIPLSETYSNEEFFHDDYWPVGINVGAAGEFRLTSWVRISPGIEYTLFPLISNYRDHFAHTSNWVAPVYSGGGFYRLQMKIDCRLLLPSDTSWIRPFLQLGGEYVFERIGMINMDFGGPSASNAKIEGEDSRFWAYGFGVGAEFHLSRHIRIESALIYHSSTDDNLYGLVNLNVHYDFEL